MSGMIEGHYGDRLWPLTADESGHPMSSPRTRRRFAYPLGVTAVTINDDEVTVSAFQLDPTWHSADGGLFEPSPGHRFVRATCMFTERIEGDTVGGVLEAFSLETDSWDAYEPIPESYAFSGLDDCVEDPLAEDQVVHMDIWFEIPLGARVTGVLFDPDSDAEVTDAPLLRFGASEGQIETEDAPRTDASATGASVIHGRSLQRNEAPNHRFAPSTDDAP